MQFTPKLSWGRNGENECLLIVYVYFGFNVQVMGGIF
jgi:hypothetical protein